MNNVKKMVNILFGITGGIAATKSPSIISALINQYGYNVKVVMTENATKFITPLTIETYSKNKVYIDMFDDRDPKIVEHIDLANWAHMFVVAPATVNTIAKFANGIADNMLTTTFLALNSYTPKFIFPAANTKMYNNIITKKNIETLSNNGCIVAQTDKKVLACGEIGDGALLSTKEIVDMINKEWGEIIKESIART